MIARVRWLGLFAWLLLWLAPARLWAAPPPEDIVPVADEPPPDEPPPDEPPPDEPPPEAVEFEQPPEGDLPEPPPEPRPPEPRPEGELVPESGSGECDIANRGDPLYPVVRTLESMKPGRLEVVDCVQLYERGFRAVQATVRGQAQDLMLYLLERLAADGFEIMLVATGTHEVQLMATAAAGSGWVYYTGVDQLSLHGSFVSGDDRERIATIVGLRNGNFFPFEYRDRLREIGYASEFFPVAAGEVVIEVRPGRSIRRVRVRGNVPIAKGDIIRQLSVQAQPGALARGQCIEPSKRGSDPPPICSSRDVACLEWERDETERIDQYLFDSGYFEGSARLALVCGRDDDEADLYVLLDKRKSFKIDRRVEVVDVDAVDTDDVGERQTLAERDQRWIRRQFIPKALGVFRTRITREFMDKAVDKVERAYAEPNTSLGRFWRSTDGMPYPEVEVRTSYEELTRESKLPASQNLPLEVRISRGAGVLTEFRPMPGSRRKTRRSSGLSFSDTQLRSKVQLFNRREPASPAGAQRESANIRAFYQSKGYLFARVQGEHLDFKSLDKLRFEIHEGPKVSIANKVEVQHTQVVGPDIAARIDDRVEEDLLLERRGSFSESDALSDIQTLLAAYNAEGYLCANVIIDIAFWQSGLDEPGTHAELDVQTLLDSGGDPKWVEQFDPAGLTGVLAADRADVYVRMRVDPGPRVLTGPHEQVHYLDEPIPFSRKVEGLLERDPGSDEVHWGAARMLRDGPLRRRNQDTPGGVPVTPSLDREARRSIVGLYHDNGHPVADAELTWSYLSPGGGRVIVDDARNLAEPRYGMCMGRRDEPAIIVDPIVNVYEGRRGDFGDILFRGNFKTRTWVLKHELEFDTDDPYSQRLVDRSAASIEATGVAKNVVITPYPTGCHWAEEGPCRVHQVIAIEEAKDVSMTIDYGIGIATLNPFYVFANPVFPNVLGTGWDFSIETRWGFDLSQVLEQSDLCAGQECYERLAAANLSRRHIFGTPFDLDINGRIQRRATPARGRIDTLIGSLRISRRFEDWTFYGGYLIQLANISKDVVKPLAGSEDGWINRSGGVVSDLTGLIDTGAILTKVDNAFNPYDGFIATMDIKLASPWLGGHDWWARLDLSWQHFIPIPGTNDRLNFRYALRYGHLLPFHGPGVGRGTRIDTETVPDVWRYYGGGTADLGLRGVLPETMLVDVEEIELPYGGTLLRPRAQGGHIRALGTVAFQFTSVKDILGGSLAHSIFYDFGVLTQFWQDVRFPRDFRHSIGANFLKFDIRIVTMALGYAFLIPGKYNVGPTDDRNGRFVFDVGVTF
ncbi:BamA/TamA family outer membrane protein [Nannocystaceae bacterium ST9]